MRGVMNTKKVFATLTVVVGIVGLALMLMQQWALSGPFVIGCFILLVLFLNQTKNFSGFSFTFIIFAAVSASLYYPGVFIGFGGFEFKSLIVPLLMIIMFGMGTSMNVRDFARVAKMPKGVFYVSDVVWLTA